MVNNIIKGICEKIIEAFGDEYDIHTERLTQDTEEPSFYVSCVSSIEKPMLGNRNIRRISISIKFIPKSKTEPSAECNDILDGLFLALECIDTGGGLARGTNMGGQFADGVLEFKADYDVFIHAVIENEPMGSFSLTNETNVGAPITQ